MSERPTLEAARLRELSRVSDLRGALDLALVWGAVFAAVALAHAVNHWAACLLAMLFIGSRQNALATLSHEAWHRLVFSRRTVNHGAGAWLTAYPIGIPYYHDRRRHMRHHREVGEPGDPDWINYTNEGKETPARVIGYLASLLGGVLFVSTALNLVLNRKPRIALEAAAESQGEDPPVAREFGCVVVCQLVLFGIFFWLFEWWTYPLLWFGSLATFAGFLANTRALLEHASADDHAPAEERLRDFAASPLEAMLLSPCHFHYHALHHAFLSIPHRNLPAAKRALIESHGHYPLTVFPSYVRSLRQHLVELSQKQETTRV